MKAMLFVAACVALAISGIVVWRSAAADPGSRETHAQTPPPKTEVTRPPDPTSGQARRRSPEPPNLDNRLWNAFNESPDPRQQRDAIRDVLASTGTSSEPWTDRARSAMNAWQQRAARSAQVRVDSVECFHKGCTAVVSFAKRSVYDDLADSMVTFEGTEKWTAQIIRSSPEFAGDGVTVEWALLRPESEQ